jgi:hypothetical protein
MIPKAPAHTLSLKDALVHAGLLDKSKAGRGRPSREMKENAEMLVRDHGYLISGFAATPSKDADKPAEVKHTPTTPKGVGILDVPDQVRFENSTEAFSIVDGKRRKVGMRTVCNNCRSSLTYCPCPSPVVNLDYNLTGVVEFRTKVLNSKENA